MRPQTNRRRRAGKSFRAPIALTLLTGSLGGLGGAACVCPAPAQVVADAGFRTPQQTVRSFQAYMASDLVDWEYRCYSGDFRRRNGISLGTYTEARAQLLRDKPWLKFFAKGEIVGEWQNSDGSHGIEVSVVGRTVHVILVREDSFEIHQGDQLLDDGYVAFDRLTRVVDAPRGAALETRIETKKTASELAQATSVVIERTWKIHELTEPDPDSSRRKAGAPKP